MLFGTGPYNQDLLLLIVQRSGIVKQHFPPQDYMYLSRERLSGEN